MKTLTATEIIKNRDFLTHNIMEDWKKIQLFNVIYKNESRDWDIKGLYKMIKKATQDRITYKLYAQAINMGYTNFNEFPASSLYSVIYEISEINSMIVQLNLVKTINPKLKLKSGKANLKQIEEITEAWKVKTINDLFKRKVTLEKLRDEFNSKATLIVEDSVIAAIAA